MICPPEVDRSMTTYHDPCLQLGSPLEPIQHHPECHVGIRDSHRLAQDAQLRILSESHSLTASVSPVMHHIRHSLPWRGPLRAGESALISSCVTPSIIRCSIPADSFTRWRSSPQPRRRASSSPSLFSCAVPTSCSRSRPLPRCAHLRKALHL